MLQDGKPGHLIKSLSLKQHEWKVWLENDSKYLKIATNIGSLYEHPLFSSRIVRTDLLPFTKPFKVILTKRFVLIKLIRNFKHKYDDKQVKYSRIL